MTSYLQRAADRRRIARRRHLNPAPVTLLTQNSELRADNVHAWTLPAWIVDTGAGHFNVCPQAGACAKFCYARNGTFNFPDVKAAHLRNLAMVREDLPGWQRRMSRELAHPRFRPTFRPRLPDLNRDHLPGPVADLLDRGAACIRVHDSGDFFDEAYLRAWLQIAREHRDRLFYCYTKAVTMFRDVAEPEAPPNFLWCFSYGGKQDHLIRDTDYRADVYPDIGALEAAGAYNQESNDLLCVTAPSRLVGIPANNIPAFNKRLDGRTFSEAEAGLTRHGRTSLPLVPAEP